VKLEKMARLRPGRPAIDAAMALLSVSSCPWQGDA
jgi:hypothetical protein